MPQMPWGNAFIIGTPKSDRLVQQIGQDQRQRELYEQRQAQLLDQEFAKNASAIRDVDIPDAIKSYQQYKAIGQELYKNGDRMNPDQRIALQLQKQRAASNYYSNVAKSKELKDVENTVQKSYFKDPNKMDEGTPDYLMASRGTPASQHPGINHIMDNVSLKTQDFLPLVTKALGKQTARNTDRVTKEDGYTVTPTDYMAYNSPQEIANTLTEGMPTQRSRNAFINQHSYSDLEAQKILNDYQALKETPAFKKAYPNQPEYTADDLADPFRKAIVLNAMQAALVHPPTAKVGKDYYDLEKYDQLKNQRKLAAEKEKDADWLLHNKISSGQKDARLNKIMGGVPVTDVLGKAEQNAKPMDVPLDLALKGVTKLIPVDQMDEREKNDAFGKPDKDGIRPIEGIKIDNKEYIGKTGDGKYKGAPLEKNGELSTIDPDAVLSSTWLREKDLKKSIQSGKAKLPSQQKLKVVKVPGL